MVSPAGEPDDAAPPPGSAFLRGYLKPTAVEGTTPGTVPSSICRAGSCGVATPFRQPVPLPLPKVRARPFARRSDREPRPPHRLSRRSGRLDPAPARQPTSSKLDKTPGFRSGDPNWTRIELFQNSFNRISKNGRAIPRRICRCSVTSLGIYSRHGSGYFRSTELKGFITRHVERVAPSSPGSIVPA